MGLFNSLFGYRWSLYVVMNRDQLVFAMHQDSVLRIVGYVMGHYAGGGRPVEPWSLHLNFNKKHQAFELTPEHFTADGDNVTRLLIDQIEAIDPGWKVPGSEPVFVEVATKKRLSIGEGVGGRIDIQAMLANVEKPRELTFFAVMDKVFGREEA